MVSTPEEATYYSHHVPIKSTQVKKTSASKSLCLFTNILNDKKKTLKRRVVATESKRRAMKLGHSLWTN